MSELLHGFVKVVLSISRPLPKKTKLKFDQDFKANWTVCFELNVLNGLILLDALDQLGLLQFFDHKLQSKHSHAQMCLNIKGLFIAAILHSIQCILYSVYYTLSSFKALNREIKPVSEYKRSGYSWWLALSLLARALPAFDSLLYAGNHLNSIYPTFFRTLLMYRIFLLWQNSMSTIIPVRL